MFEQKRLNKKVYSPVNFNGRYILKKKEILPYFLEDVSSKNLSNNNNSQNDDKKKLKIKIKSTKKENLPSKKIKIKKSKK